MSIGVGLFVGAIPIYGFQLLLVLVICIPLRLDAAVAYVAAHISNPLTLPFLLALELEIGARLLTGQHAVLDWKAAKEVGVGGYAAQLACGSLVLGAALFAAGAAASLVVARSRSNARVDAYALAIRRTVARYRDAPRSVRMYVRAKLDNDPSLRALLKLEGSFERVTDAGCGFGYMGLSLLELGRLQSLYGFDPEQRSIDEATRAARGDANFGVAGFADAPWPSADTVLMFDSLHYTTIDVQNEALRRAATSLAPGGRLILREVDARRGLRSALTQWSERISARLRNKRAAMQFRNVEDLLLTLTALGLTPRVLDVEEWSPFDNVLIVATKPSVESSS